MGFLSSFSSDSTLEVFLSSVIKQVSIDLVSKAASTDPFFASRGVKSTALRRKPQRGSPKELMEVLEEEEEDVPTKDDNTIELNIPNRKVPPGWRAAIRHLHARYGHPSNAALARQLGRGGSPQRLLDFVMDNQIFLIYI